VLLTTSNGKNGVSPAGSALHRLMMWSQCYERCLKALCGSLRLYQVGLLSVRDVVCEQLRRAVGCSGCVLLQTACSPTFISAKGKGRVMISRARALENTSGSLQVARVGAGANRHRAGPL
jgi:hypothetical protein